MNIIQQINKEFDENFIREIRSFQENGVSVKTSEIVLERDVTDIKQFLNDAIRRVLEEVSNRKIEYSDGTTRITNTKEELLKELDKQDESNC